MTGSPVDEGKKGAQPNQLGFGKGGHVGEGVIVRKHRTKRHHQDFVDAMPDPACHAEVWHLSKSEPKAFEAGPQIGGGERGIGRGIKGHCPYNYNCCNFVQAIISIILMRKP